MHRTGTLEGLQRCVSSDGEPFEVELDGTAVRLLLEATGDQNPMWQGAAGEAEVPPYVLCCSKVSGSTVWPKMPWPFRRGVDGGGEWEILAPIKSGDKLTAVCKFKELGEREGKSGKMYLAIMETTVRNQHGIVVGKARATNIGFDPVTEADKE